MSNTPTLMQSEEKKLNDLSGWVVDDKCVNLE